jgi:hypothetical protein
MKSYKKTGKIGTSKPKSKKKAQKQSVAIALAKAGKSTKKKSEQAEESKAKCKINENSMITSFINRIFEKNYNAANKYLTDILNSKLQKRIEDELITPLF